MFRAGFSRIVPALILIASISCNSSDRQGADRKEGLYSSRGKDILLFAGKYNIFEEGKTIGFERFEIYLLESGKRKMVSESILDPGYKYQHDAEFYLGDRGRIESAVIRFHGGGITRKAAIENRGDSIYCEISVGDGRPVMYSLPSEPGYRIKYDLSIFYIPVFAELDLKPGEFIDLNMLLIELDSLKPFEAVFRFQLLEEGVIQIPAGEFTARKYVVSDLHNRQKRYYRVDGNNITLSRGKTEKGNDVARLIEYIKGEEIQSPPPNK